jgi:hypothetical protein
MGTGISRLPVTRGNRCRPRLLIGRDGTRGRLRGGSDGFGGYRRGVVHFIDLKIKPRIGGLRQFNVIFFNAVGRPVFGKRIIRG